MTGGAPDVVPDGPDPEPPDLRDDSDDIIAAGGKVDARALERLYSRENGDDDTPVTVRFVLARDLQKRLDRYLTDRIPFLSRTSLQRLIREDAVRVNGRRPKASTNLRRGDVVVAVLPPPPSTSIPAEDIPLEIVYEDDDLVIVNKHDDIIVHPARGNRSGTMINGLAWHFKHRTGGGLSPVGTDDARPGVVHRLDRHTTGVIVFAKTETAHWRIGKQFENRTTEKRYLALVHGRVEPDADVIDLPLGKHPTVKYKYAVRWDTTGKESVTLYRVLERYDDFSLVELELKTGRTHQIRVHLSHLGWPIAGDDVYGGKFVTVGDIAGPAGADGLGPREVVVGRQALHAALLGFTHPITKKRVEFTSPLKPDMAGAVRLLREHRRVERVKVAGTRLDLDALLP